MKMKKQITSAICGMLCLTLLLGLTWVPQQVEAAASKKLTYTNLVDKRTKNQVKKELENAGIPKENVESFLNYVTYYNKGMSGVTKAAKGYRTVSKAQPGYDEAKAVTLWDKKRKDGLDLNCRLTSYTLMKGMIKTAPGFRGQNTSIKGDLDVIKNYPLKNYGKKDIQSYQNIYGDVKVTKLLQPKEAAKKVQKFWKKNKVTFKTGPKVSLINVFMYFDLDNVYFVGHTGILVKSGSGYLFVEKYGPTLPYQITKFSTKNDLYLYLMNRLDTGDGQYASGAFVMENNKLMNPAGVKQSIKVQKVKGKSGKNGQAEITYMLGKRSDVTVSIYSKSGKMVYTKKEKQISPTDSHVFTWNGKASRGNKMKLKQGALAPKGSYYAKITAEKTTVKTKLFTLK